MNVAKMSTLESLGYKPSFFRDGRWPSESWVRVSEGGRHRQTLTFDTIHGGPWVFECGAESFLFNERLGWTSQERDEFDPSSRAFVGCDVGHWQWVPAVLSVEECQAIAEHITMLETKRPRKDGVLS